MTLEIAAVLLILFGALALFVSERLRMDLVALLVLIALAVTGLVTAEQAVSGFSNPAVITVWAVFIISAGLERTGVAGVIGHHVLGLAGSAEWRLILMIMLAAGLMSAFMNNVGVAALLLPVVMDLARRTGRKPSRLLMPLAFGTLLGGMLTLIGTPPNILVNAAIEAAAEAYPSMKPFGFFEFAPVGIVVFLSGVAFMVLVGRYLLPRTDVADAAVPEGSGELGDLYDLQNRLRVLRLPMDSPLIGSTLAESRMGAALGLNVVAILRGEGSELAPGPGSVLEPGDRLLVEGDPSDLHSLVAATDALLEEARPDATALVSEWIATAELTIGSKSPLVGSTLRKASFRQRYGAMVLALRRDEPIRTGFHDEALRSDDVLLVQGAEDTLSQLADDPSFSSMRFVHEEEMSDTYQLHDLLTALQIPSDSLLEGRTLLQSRLGDAFGLAVLGIGRGGDTLLLPDPDETLHSGDVLLVKASPEALQTLHGLHGLELDRAEAPDVRELESHSVGLSEVVLSPHTRLDGSTLRRIHFREKYGLTVLAIWRQGKAYRAGLRDMPLRFGDAMLLYGQRERLAVLGSEPDFIVLTESAQRAPLREKARIATVVAVLVLLSAVLGLLPIAIAAVVGAVAMVLTGCLNMRQAHRAINWPVVFIIAGMLPLGIAMQETGAASLLANKTVELVGGAGPMAVLAAMFVLSAVASQVMPNAAVAVLLAPIVMNVAADMGVSPYPLLMGVAVSASAAFMSPVAHPSNSLVMGPGGYRFVDFLRVGLPVLIVVTIVALLVIPIVWPF